jgi:hypothetical protein
MLEERIDMDSSLYNSPVSPVRTTSRAPSPVLNGGGEGAGSSSSHLLSASSETAGDSPFAPNASPGRLRVSC